MQLFSLWFVVGTRCGQRRTTCVVRLDLGVGRERGLRSWSLLGACGLSPPASSLSPRRETYFRIWIARRKGEPGALLGVEKGGGRTAKRIFSRLGRNFAFLV